MSLHLGNVYPGSREDLSAIKVAEQGFYQRVVLQVLRLAIEVYAACTQPLLKSTGSGASTIVTGAACTSLRAEIKLAAHLDRVGRCVQRKYAHRKR